MAHPRPSRRTDKAAEKASETAKKVGQKVEYIGKKIPDYG